MTDNNKNPQEDNSSKKPDELETLHRPKHIMRKNPLDLERSKSAPIEEITEGAETNEYLSSYNYYIYYNSIKPKDPRLPKPTYKPKPNLAYIKENQNEEEDDGKGNNNQNDDLNEEFNKLSLEENGNSSKNDQNFTNENLFNNDNYINKNQIQNLNSLNDNPSVPSALD